jgi:flagella basal body P-ring formation protein FlgA
MLLAWGLSCEVAFAQAVVATHTLRPGDIVAAEDVQMSEVGNHSGYTDISLVLGLEVQRILYRGRPIRGGDVGPPALVERNEVVTLIYRTGALNISAEGRSLGRGAIGAIVKVLNLASKITVVGRVSETGEIIVSRE